MNTQLQGTARLGSDPELRFTPGGKAICELRLAFSSSTKDRKTGEYVYSPAIWVTATLWETMAQNAVDVLRKGDEVVAVGQLELEKFAKRDGGEGEKLVLRNAEVAPSIRRQKPGALASAARSDSRPAAANGRHADQRAQVGAQARTQAVDNDPWGGSTGADPPF